MSMVFRDGGTLACPFCEGETTHVDVVRAYSAGGQSAFIEAMGEDQNARLGSGASFHKENVGRRHEFRFYIDCEECGATTEVTLRQHKGATLISTRTIATTPATPMVFS